VFKSCWDFRFEKYFLEILSQLRKEDVENEKTFRDRGSECDQIAINSVVLSILI